MFDLDHYPVEMEYEYSDDWRNPHVVSFKVPSDAMFFLRDVMPSRVRKFALKHDFAIERVSIGDREAATTFGMQAFADWLRNNVGEADDDWMLSSVEGNLDWWVRVRFADKNKAMMFKLTHSSN
ncbi:hypothetical protein [Methylobacterium sp. SD21]|uniref:hypothetical protein n=1 Tax=Methylobacterium litchii TaxID=3138810 RepID=UPI00313CA3DB